jgi:hypothetical protein
VLRLDLGRDTEAGLASVAEALRRVLAERRI